MKTAMILFAGTVIASALFAEASDPFAEERYRMKYGQYTPAEQERRMLAREAQQNGATEYVGQACCRHMPSGVGAVSTQDLAVEGRHRAKFGRNTPAFEARQKAVQAAVADHVGKCAGLGRCPLVRAHATADPPAIATSDTEMRLRMKLGRSLPAQERRPAAPRVPEDRRLLASTAHSPCEEPCCKQAE